MIVVGIGLVIVALVAVLLWDRVVWHWNDWRTRIHYAVNPPEEVVFVPSTPQVNVTVLATPTGTATSIPPTPPAELTAEPTEVPSTPVPTATPFPLPSAAAIPGVPYVDQHGLFNYCAPANLAMAMAFWGWPGSRTDIGEWVKPFEEDKNVMPYELANYVESQTGLAVVVRAGGDMDLLRRAVAAGFPVLVETGTMMRDLTGKVSWMGHYQLVTAYNDETARITVQDSYYEADRVMPYTEFNEFWWSFNNTYLLVYPPERAAEVETVLGESWSEAAAWEKAAQRAESLSQSAEGQEQFFAYYNLGSSLVNLQRYAEGAAAFDQAFALYQDLPPNRRPWRILWYQTGPYFAYYHSGRFEDVIRLATQTIEAASQPYLEESWYWRGLAKAAMGDNTGAQADFQKSLEYHPGFGPTLLAQQNLGGG